MKIYRSAIDPELVEQIAVFAEMIIGSRPRDELIERNGDPFFERWYLARKSRFWHAFGEDTGRTLFSELENIYIHRFVRSDVEDPHCHPWANASLVVRGGYLEHRYDDGVPGEPVIHTPGDIVLRGADQVHAIAGCESGTITLFATLRKERDWGFWTPSGFVPWDRYSGRHTAFEAV